MIFRSELVYVALAAVFVVAGFILAKNRTRFLLATGVITIAWQGGLWINYFDFDLTLTYVVFGMLFLWNFIGPGGKGVRVKGDAIPLYFWGGVILFSLLAVMPAIDKNYARLGFVRTLLDMVIFFAVIKALRTPSDVRFFTKTILLALLFQGTLSLIQYKFPHFKVGVIDAHQSWMWWRTKGTFFHANEMGMFCLLLTPLAIRIVFRSMMERNRNWIILSSCASAVGLVALVTTANRGSWLGLAGGMFFMLGYDLYKSGRTNRKLKRILAMLAGPAMIFLVAFSIKFGPRLVDRLFYDNADEMIEGRLRYQEEAIEIIKSFPIFGVGYKNYLNHVDSYFVHNMYLLAASEIGIPGLIFLSGFLLGFLWLILRGMHSKIFYVSNMSRGMFATMLGFLVASIPGPDFWISHPIQLYFWMLVALQISLLYFEKQAEQRLRRQKMKMQVMSRSRAEPALSPADPVASSHDADERRKSPWNIRLKDTPDRR